MYQSVPEQKAQLLQKGDTKRYCPSCGMDLVKFYKTSHALHKDGHDHQYCSLHCLVEANPNTDLIDAKVVDQTSLKFINAHDAYYVAGSSKPGTMTTNSKYAFASVQDATAFAKAYGGEILNFHEALKMASADLINDTKMINKKRSMASEKGTMMYTKLCKKSPMPEFDSYAKAKAYLLSSQVCGTLKDKQAQAIAIYLVNKTAIEKPKAIAVPKDAKCPICGMFVSKYPKWAAKITTKEPKAYYFDGNKDLMKYYFKTKENLDEILVTDYYSITSLPAKKAFYVTGSNVYGPMGHELISFATQADAERFKKDHFGKKVLSFEAITPAIVAELDH
jgi:nitrous oxide reductase accessory protein NosL